MGPEGKADCVVRPGRNADGGGIPARCKVRGPHGGAPRAYYGRFVDLWKNADRELQPVVRDVRGRLARLAGER